MRSSPLPFLGFLGFASLLALGCQAPPGDEPAAAASSEDALSGAGSECVIDTLFVKKGLLADLAASVDPSLIKDYGPSFYKHVEIPKTIDAALASDYGEALYSLHGWDFHPEELPSGSTKTPRFVATLAGSTVVDAKLTFAKKRFAAAKALFDGLTQANETTVDHVVPPSHVYDRSSTKVTRTSPAGRVVCDKTTYPDSSSVDYACTLFDVERNMVQSYNTKDAHCLTQ